MNQEQINYLYHRCLHPYTWEVWIPEDKSWILDKFPNPKIGIAIGFCNELGWFCISKENEILYSDFSDVTIPESDIPQDINSYIFACADMQ